ncbi:MAG: hypothetical protein Q7S87_08735 [Agitococcus sp.]|nr:hypothetical protein [Agitococcus sp.]MDO9176983.1 hypothetical protein [Agitococcus sp.]
MLKLTRYHLLVTTFFVLLAGVYLVDLLAANEVKNGQLPYASVSTLSPRTLIPSQLDSEIANVRATGLNQAEYQEGECLQQGAARTLTETPRLIGAQLRAPKNLPWCFLMSDAIDETETGPSRRTRQIAVIARTIFADKKIQSYFDEQGVFSLKGGETAVVVAAPQKIKIRVSKYFSLSTNYKA